MHLRSKRNEQCGISGVYTNSSVPRFRTTVLLDGQEQPCSPRQCQYECTRNGASRNARKAESQGPDKTELAKILHNDAGLMAKIDFVAQENADIPPYVKRLFKRGKGCGNLRAKALNTLELATVLHKNAGLMGKKDLMVQGNANMNASKIALEAKQVMLNLRAQTSYSNCKMFRRDAGLMVMKDLVVPRIRSGGKSSLKCN